MVNQSFEASASLCSMDVAVCLFSFVNFNCGVEENFLFFRNLDFFPPLLGFLALQGHKYRNGNDTYIAFEQE